MTNFCIVITNHGHSLVNQAHVLYTFMAESQHNYYCFFLPLAAGSTNYKIETLYFDLEGSINKQTHPSSLPEWMSPVAALAECTTAGLSYYNETNDFRLEITEGAIPEGESLTIDVGVALSGPFRCPKGVRLTSAVFSIHVRGRQHFSFLKPIEITLQHCLSLQCTADIREQGIMFLEGEPKLAVGREYRFNFKLNETAVSTKFGTRYGVLLTRHFNSFVCIASTTSNAYIERALFCIHAAIPRSYYFHKPAYMHLFATNLLATCARSVMQRVREIPESQFLQMVSQEFSFADETGLDIVLPSLRSQDWFFYLKGNRKVCRPQQISRYVSFKDATWV